MLVTPLNVTSVDVFYIILLSLLLFFTTFSLHIITFCRALASSVFVLRHLPLKGFLSIAPNATRLAFIWRERFSATNPYQEAVHHFSKAAVSPLFVSLLWTNFFLVLFTRSLLFWGFRPFVASFTVVVFSSQYSFDPSAFRSYVKQPLGSFILHRRRASGPWTARYYQ